MTFNRTALEIINDYYQALNEGFKTGNLHSSKLHFAEDIVLVGPGEIFEGKKAAEQALTEFLVPFTKRFDLIHQIADAHSACTVIDCITKKSITVPCAEWVRVSGGKIAEIRCFYDTAAWEKVIK